MPGFLVLGDVDSGSNVLRRFRRGPDPTLEARGQVDLRRGFEYVDCFVLVERYLPWAPGKAALDA